MVIGSGTDYIDLSKTDAEFGSGVPSIGDDILQLGNRTDKTRQAALMLSARNTTNGPTLTMYNGIDSYSLEDKLRTQIGRNSIFRGTLVVTSEGGDYQVPADRGEWQEGVVYYYYDRVSHLGSLWLCIVESTTIEPSDNVPNIWEKQVEKGDTGDYTAYVYTGTNGVVASVPTPTFTGIPTPAGEVSGGYT